MRCGSKVVAGLVLVSSAIMAQSAAVAAPSTGPTTAPVITPEARLLLDKLDAAYRGLSSATFAGTVGANIDVAGNVQNELRPFTAAFSAQKLRFRHEAPNEILLGSSGESLYAFRPGPNAYVSQPAPTERIVVAELAQPYQMILRTQNPSLMLALSKDPAAELVRNVASVTRGPDVALAGAKYPALVLASEDGTVVTAAIDPATSLLRQVTFDLKKVAESRGAPNVKCALLTNDYTTVTVGADALPSFDWAPPAGAKDEAAAAAPPGEQMADATKVLLGKPAPDFTLKADDDKEQKLSDLKGSVVILDFWATWCPPCREGLPVLDGLSKDNAAKGLKVLGLNLREDKDTVAKFKTKTSLGLRVLFDSEGAVAEKYKVTGIPQTVIIDKLGVVRKVLVGFDPAEKAELEKLVAELTRE